MEEHIIKTKQIKNQVDDLNNCTITVIAEEGGTVEGFESGSKQCRLGTQVVLKAVPDVITIGETEYSWSFAGWYLNDELKSTDSEYTITVTGYATYVAKFATDYTFIYYADGTIVADASSTINSSSGYKGDTNITKVIFGRQVLSLGASAFEGCTNLESINIPENVKTINSRTFIGCVSLKELNIPGVETVKSSNAFKGCSSLRKVKLEKIKSIEGWDFEDCTLLEEVQLGSKNNPVTSLHYGTFNRCTQNNLIIKVYIEDGQTSLSGAPWGATNATIEYYNASTGEKIN